jgi:DNA-binding NtrC family response regulator
MLKMSDAKILIVDDEPAARFGMRRTLDKLGYTIEEAADGQTALRLIMDFKPDIVLCDINMPKMNGLQLVQDIQNLEVQNVSKPLVIVITAYGSERIAVSIMKAGAYDYLNKPYDVDELRLVVKNALEKRFLEFENVRLRQQLLRSGKPQIIGESPAIKNVLQVIQKVAPTDVTVLLTGESGTGKELVAQTIHTMSLRGAGPFITMNCAAIPKDLVESELFGHEKGAFTGATAQRQGKFELANSGTIFLDEIADMSLETQAKILRVLEDKSFTRLGGKDLIHTDVRLISATNRELTEEIRCGRFREDLFYRIRVVEIKLPKLLERKSDIPLLIEHFLKQFSLKHNKNVLALDPQALKILLEYEWPGNIRQLMNIIEQSVVLSDGHLLTVDHLVSEIPIRQAGSGPINLLDGESFAVAKERAMRQIELHIIDKALRNSAGNISQAARSLKMKRQFLQQKMKALGIDGNKFRSGKN